MSLIIPQLCQFSMEASVASIYFPTAVYRERERKRGSRVLWKGNCQIAELYKVHTKHGGINVLGTGRVLLVKKTVAMTANGKTLQYVCSC